MPDNSYDGQSKVYMKQGATAMVVASGGSIILEAGGVISGLGVHEGLGAHLFAARELASAENFASGTSAPTLFWGGVLDSETTPKMAMNSTADQSFFLEWASGNADGVKLPPIAMRPEFSTAGGLSIDLYGETGGTGSAADAIQAITVKAFFGAGNANVGSTHANFTSTPGWQTVTVASGSVVANVPLNLTLIPQAHTGRTVRLYDMRLRYSRSS